MKNNLLKTVLCATLLLGTCNNISCTMENNHINEQINDNSNLCFNNLQK